VKALSTSQLLLDSGPLIVRRGAELRTYPPRAIDKLHRKFAAIGDTPDDVLEFVQIYGFLGVETPGMPSEIDSESVRAILQARNDLREAVSTFDELRSEESWMKRRGEELGDNGEGLHDASPEQVAEVAFFSRQRAGELFNKWAAPNLFARLRPGVTSRGAPRLTLHVEPRTLLAAMWLQVAEELTGSLRTCIVCSAPIDASARSDKKTCSDACRQALSTSQKPPKKTAKQSKHSKKGTK